MASTLILRNRNYRLLFASGALTNLGDGLVMLAIPWLATLLTRDPVAIAAVAAAGRLPWLFFALPAGVIADQVDRRKLIARADLLRATLVAGAQCPRRRGNLAARCLNFPAWRGRSPARQRRPNHFAGHSDTL